MTVTAKPEIKANRKSYDDMPVQFWTDGRITIGRTQVYAGSARGERKMSDTLLKWTDTYTAEEIRKLCK